MNQPVGIKPGRYWHTLEDGRVQCDVCPRYCKLHEGQRGLCFVRARQSDQIVLTTYGRSSGFCIDPIEKKPLNHFLPGTPVLSFGTAGCNLTCKFCQNWDISKARNFDRIQDFASPEAIAEAAVRNGCRSVAFTYNDPVIFLEYAVDVARACRERGIKTVAVSAGYISSEPRIEFFRHMDAANIDLKGFTDAFYSRSPRAFWRAFHPDPRHAGRHKSQRRHFRRLGARPDGHCRRHLRLENREGPLCDHWGRCHDVPQAGLRRGRDVRLCKLIRIGTTSITVGVEAWAIRRNQTNRILVTEGNFTYVAVDDNGRPRKVEA